MIIPSEKTTLRRAFKSGVEMDFPFTTDHCSLFPDGNWGGCCVTHDKAYWEGGSAAEKLEADLALMRCVALSGHPIIAAIMFIGVRFGGLPYWPVPWRWGYGWKYRRAPNYTTQEHLIKYSVRSTASDPELDIPAFLRKQAPGAKKQEII